MENFVFWNPVKIYFGRGQLASHLGEELAKCGKKALLAYGGGSIKKIGLYDEVCKAAKEAGVELIELSGIEPNPRVTSVRDGARLCREHGIDVVLAVGGGSTIDASKWIAAGACADHDVWDFFVKGAKVERALPLIAVLTLSATGSEMDAGGVITNLETEDKLGMASPLLFPKASFLDPTVTYTVSAYQTACGAADIMSHVMETYFSTHETMYMVDNMMEGLMRTVVRYAPTAITHPDDYEARANLMWASSWGINGFVRAGYPQAWSCHPMEHELSAKYDITHGLGLAILTPRWLRYCLKKAPETAPRISRFGRAVFGIDTFGSEHDSALRAIAALEEFLFCTLGLDDTLSGDYVREEHLAEMAKKACRKGTIKGFIPLDPEDVEAIYKMCMEH